ncbi:unnamed protein product [Rhizophagus irregularis]|nr:unnamed protein product [Rhizophagus irregularis]
MFTNADPALDAAIPIIFSETYPAHCIFHITQNLPENLKAKLDYLLHTLDQNSRFWAQTYIHKIFTAGIESTAKVESYN